MKTKITITITILLLCLLSLCTSCSDDECSCQKQNYLIKQQVNPTVITHELQSVEDVICQDEKQVQQGTSNYYFKIVCD